MSIANYAMLAMLNMAALALIPLVWSIPIELGGLGMSPGWISGYGALSAVFPRVVDRTLWSTVCSHQWFHFLFHDIRPISVREPLRTSPHQP